MGIKLDGWQYLVGHVLEVLHRLPDKSVHSVTTSPPYFGLRVYQGDQNLIWGGMPGCEHDWSISGGGLLHENRNNLRGSQDSVHGKTGTAHIFKFDKESSHSCSKCSAWRGSFGLEPSIDMYVKHTIEIMREIRRVLRDDGVLFWNIGDSYAGGGRGAFLGYQEGMGEPLPPQKPTDGLKPKDLCLVPFRVALAAQADGWWVRCDIIWSKHNCTPDPVSDRPTRNHEYILMLTKSGDSTFWTHRDKNGTRARPEPDFRWNNVFTGEEVATEPTDANLEVVCPDCEGKGERADLFGCLECETCGGEGVTTKWKRFNLWTSHDYFWDKEAVKEEGTYPAGTKAAKGSKKRHSQPLVNSRPPEYKVYDGMRNIRSVWSFPTRPYRSAHFACFPSELPTRTITASTSEKGVCPKCGAPWTRKTRKEMVGDIEKTVTTGWAPTCDCNEPDTVPALVLDPFAGSGTTIEVSRELGRHCIGIDISEKYQKLGEKRANLKIPDIFSFK